MILGFKTIWPDGRPTFFKEKIQAHLKIRAGNDYIPKIHTFRNGNRWREGMVIHMATGVRTKNYQQFAWGTCKGVQDAQIYMLPDSGLLIWISNEDNKDYGRQLSPAELLLFAANDGFNSVEELIKWFFPKGPKEDGIVGQIIHFTDFKY